MVDQNGGKQENHSLHRFIEFDNKVVIIKESIKIV